MASTNDQAAKALPSDLSVHLTGHDATTGKAIVQETRPAQWTTHDNGQMKIHLVYTTSQSPPSLNDDKDIRQHDELLKAGNLGLVRQNGSVARVVDFAPGFDCMMHRTQSLDFGVVVSGAIEMVLDSGEVKLLSPGDFAVQRATMHAWRNPSKTEWARMVFVLQDCEPLVVGGQPLKEDYGRGVDGIPASGNDA